LNIRFCDLPRIEGPNGRFMLQQMAAVAELEEGLIGDRTRKALAAATAPGQKLGNPQNLRNRDIGSANGQAVRVKAANSRAADLKPIIAEIQAAGAVSLREIAAGLNGRGVLTARGGQWSAVQVQRVLARVS
jgi:DNA invertase Pin-like site-specific DNA recombinase